jgi:hypothetical protein
LALFRRQLSSSAVSRLRTAGCAKGAAQPTPQKTCRLLPAGGLRAAACTDRARTFSRLGAVRRGPPEPECRPPDKGSAVRNSLK